MKTTLPSIENLEINQSTAAVTAARLARVPRLLLLVAKGSGKKLPPGTPLADTISDRLKRNGQRDKPTSLTLELANAAGTCVTVGFVDADAEAFSRQTTLRKLLTMVERAPGTQLAVAFSGLGDQTLAWADAAVVAASAHAFELAQFKSKPKRKTSLRKLSLLGMPKRLDTARSLAAAAGNNLARWLSALPGNALTPAIYRRHIATLARTEGWRVETLDQRALQRKGCGAFLAVVQASTEKDAAIVRVRYRPTGRSKARGHIALVGKGICYDTGGVNLKPANYMFGMHEDMAGSATALGTLLALSRLGAPFEVDCWLALAQNHIGPASYKPNDVITACDGTTIEIVHTDAEGRMVLADTLALVARTKPDLCIDYATLTGACVGALGTRYAGVFTNRSALNAMLIDVGRASGERVWPFPQDEDYDQAIESTVADIKQCTLSSSPDHILAARFLSRFIGKDTPWVHMDLATAPAKGGLGAIPTDSTGFGVRFTVEALLDSGILAACKH